MTWGLQLQQNVYCTMVVLQQSQVQIKVPNYKKFSFNPKNEYLLFLCVEVEAGNVPGPEQSNKNVTHILGIVQIWQGHMNVTHIPRTKC